MAALSVRERMVVGAGAAVALVVGGYLFLVEPLVTRARAVEAAVPAREAALERRRLLVSRRPRLTEELASVTARLEVESARLLRGPTPPLAAAELQKVIKDLLPGGVEIRSERVLAPSALEGLQEIGIELALVGSIRDTVGALGRLERADRLLALRDVKIRLVAPAQPRDLLTTVTVAGYLLPGAAGDD
ncbi:MAG TPA: type II secretion system protein GspM [Candidatus Deferrimicrobiaceae bacterium]|nr:type II secretion system protein GspM [Candidatus Deferrimicrobiaceae bacterium]